MEAVLLFGGLPSRGLSHGHPLLDLSICHFNVTSKCQKNLPLFKGMYSRGFCNAVCSVFFGFLQRPPIRDAEGACVRVMCWRGHQTWTLKSLVLGPNLPLVNVEGSGPTPVCHGVMARIRPQETAVT